MIRESLGRAVRPAVALTALLMLITGVLYPGLVTGIAQLIFPRQADGSLIERDGNVVGSALIGQTFTSPAYFHARPSAAGAGYDGAASSGTNKGPTDRKLADTLIANAVAEALSKDGAVRGEIPTDMVTASGSGLDPHISPANADLQVRRIANARGAAVDAIRALVARHTEGRQLGFLGEARVNVLLLNLALDSAFAPTGVR